MFHLIHPKSIVILDFGGQYAHLIGNRIRRLGAFSEIHEPEIAVSELQNAAGIILSGGPQSVYDAASPQADSAILTLGIPILGICYGHQWLAHALKGKVKEGKTKEYGQATIGIVGGGGALFRGLPEQCVVWMSHGDEVEELPAGFCCTASSPACAVSAMESAKRRIFGLQFHPEVTHTPCGMDILKRFTELCRPAPWSVENILPAIEETIRREAFDKRVFILVSGGIDSTVAFTLLNRTLGEERVFGLHVDHGLMRKNENAGVREVFRRLGYGNLHIEDASDRFFGNLKDIYDPEEKRKVIGATFLQVHEDVARRLTLDGPDWMLGQGTIYPDTIETGGTKHADQIKTHHNRIEAIETMIREGKVIEPLKDLYKDEVRKLGELLGLPDDIVWRHPFPGPGLATRILCAREPDPLPCIDLPTESKLFSLRLLPVKSVGVQGDKRSYKHAVALFVRKPLGDLESLFGLATSIPNTEPTINRVLLCTSHREPPDFAFTPGYITPERVALAQEADWIVDGAMRETGIAKEIWQFPVVLLPLGASAGKQSIVLRPVSSDEAMTANAYPLSEEFLKSVTEKLLRLPGIDLVFYDLTNKPPATIEWE